LTPGTGGRPLRPRRAFDAHCSNVENRELGPYVRELGPQVKVVCPIGFRHRGDVRRRCGL